MKKKSLVMMLSSLALVGTIMVGATFAYFTSTTDAAKNTFTVGDNLKIELWEDVTQTTPAYQNFVYRGTVVTTPTTADFKIASVEDGAIFKNMYPGLTLDKKPYVINTSTQSCYVRVKVSGIKDLKDKGFVVTMGDAWEKIPNSGEGQDGIYQYNTILANANTSDDTDVSAELIKTVKFNGKVEGKNYTEEMKIDLTAYAVQSFGFETAGASAAFAAEKAENPTTSPIAAVLQ